MKQINALYTTEIMITSNKREVLEVKICTQNDQNHHAATEYVFLFAIDKQ